MDQEEWEYRIRQMLGNADIEADFLDYCYKQNMTITQTVAHYYQLMDVKIPPQFQGR